jgi:ribosomal protein L37AE/L43A
MRLDLTLQEAERLRHCLTETLASHAGDADEQLLKKLLEKVIEAESRSTQQHRCPVCQQLFTREAVGRTGVYCSAACKQKAYRQRRNAWRREFDPRASK